MFKQFVVQKFKSSSLLASVWLDHNFLLYL